MSFGFLGIQFGWGLQMANMSPIYKYLGACDDQIPLLWLAARMQLEAQRLQEVAEEEGMLPTATRRKIRRLT